MLTSKVGIIVCLVAFLLPAELTAQLFLSEGFEEGAKPVGWTEEHVVGSEAWRFRNGGHSPNDNNWLIPPEDGDLRRNPDGAYEGTYNAIFFKQGEGNERSRLITPELNLLGSVAPELSFYLCQIPWSFEGAVGWDVLRVYYKTTETANWELLQEFLDPVYDWELQSIALPNPSQHYYIAFEGQSRWGYGCCIDMISIEETQPQSLQLSGVEFSQDFESFTPSGAKDVPLLRCDLIVSGSYGTASLSQLSLNSLNSDDTDVDALKLYYSADPDFDSKQLIATGGFQNGQVSFTSINHSLPSGISYLWLCCDVNAYAIHSNILDVELPAGAIQVGSTNLPQSGLHPKGYRVVHKTIYKEDFEGTHAWSFNGEFESGTPNGGGGQYGYANPTGAYSGSISIGTDLNGSGLDPYNYEAGLSDATYNLASSPEIKSCFHKNLMLSYKRYLNIEVWDKAAIELSKDNGSTWTSIWENTSYINDSSWTHELISIPDEFSGYQDLKLRFRLGPTNSIYNYSGWHIDDLYITGEYLSTDVGVCAWLSPESGSDLGTNETVSVAVKNYGGEHIYDEIPVAFSLDSGATWTIDHLQADIAASDSVIFSFSEEIDLSEHGTYSNILARTILPGDQYFQNNGIATSIVSLPTIEAPVTLNFEASESYWRAEGLPLWEYGTPAGDVIQNASSGSKVWITGLDYDYEEALYQDSEIVFNDDFESDKGWSFSGEFERAMPDNTNPPPNFAYEGWNCIGTDIAVGAGAQPFAYENNISSANAYTATSPALDIANYKNLELSFARWLEIEAGDSIKLELSADDGLSWQTLWKNEEGAISDGFWKEVYYYIPDQYSSTTKFRLRFSLFYSNGSGVSQGLSVDKLILRASPQNDVPAYLISPAFDLRSLITPVMGANLFLDTENGTDGASISYSTDDEQTWVPLDNVEGEDAAWNWYSGNYLSALGRDGWSGQSGSWISVMHTLPAALHGSEQVQFRLEFAADKQNNSFDGIAIDDFELSEHPLTIVPKVTDLSARSFAAPKSSCELSASEEIRISIKNTGTDTIPASANIQMKCSINGLPEYDEVLTLSSDLYPNQSLLYAFSTPRDFSADGNYVVEVELTFAADEVAANNKISRTVRNYDCPDVIPDIKISSLLLPETDCLHSEEELVSIRIENSGETKLLAGESILLNYSVNGQEAVQESYTLSSDLDIGESFDYSFTQREDFSAIANYELVVFCAYAEDLRAGNDIIFRTISTLGAPQVDIGNGEDTLYIDAPITLSAEAGHAGYRWQDESTNSSYAIINPGFSLYSVEVTSFSGCSSSDEVYVSYDLPDIGITELPGIGNTCISEETTPMRVEVQNNGFFNLTSKDEITLSYYVNDESSHSETFSFSPDLPPGSRRTFEFEQGLDFSKTGNYNIRAVLSWEKDRQALNNDFLSLISVHDEAFINLEDGADTLVVNLPYMLSAGNTYTDYRWQDGSDQSNFWAYSSGTYWVEIVNEYGCSGSDTIYLRDILAARSMSADSEISIFPNPAQDYLNIQFENMEETELLLQLFNSSSQLLYKHQLHIGQLQTHRIPMQDLPPGIYTLNICHKEKVLNYKILKTTK